jgi:DNA-binding transcriptional LysR family regulator
MHSSMGWDDLRFVLAVGRNGSLSGAARALKVNHSTVFRRIAQLEKGLGVRLFDRLPEGYAPTSAGEALIALGGRVEEEVVALERRLAGEDLRPSGVVRVTTTDTLVPFLTPVCARFRLVQPQVQLELIVGQERLNLSRRDADVALRPTSAPPETLVGRRLSGIAMAIYGADAYLATTVDETPLIRHDWIGYDDSLSHLTADHWLRQRVAPERIVMRSNNLMAICEAVRAGIGLALLPCYLADDQPMLRRVGDPLPELTTDLWLLVHEDLRRTARIRAFMDHLAGEVAKVRNRLEAREAAPTA